MIFEFMIFEFPYGHGAWKAPPRVRMCPAGSESFACAQHLGAQSFGMRAGNELGLSMNFPAGRGLRQRAGTPAPWCGNMKFKLRIRG
jgi:hypothetical protein